jgi:hypothetical protein
MSDVFIQPTGPGIPIEATLTGAEELPYAITAQVLPRSTTIGSTTPATNSFTDIQSARFITGLNEVGSFDITARAGAQGNFLINPANSVVRIFLGPGHGTAGTGYDVFYGVIESTSVSGVTSNSLVPIVRFAGRGIGAVYEEMLVVAPGKSATRDFVNQTPGFIFKTLYDEAVARGCPNTAPPDFTATHDSNGVAWASTVSLEIQVGSTLADVLSQLSDLAVDVSYRAGVRMFNAGTVGRGSFSAPFARINSADITSFTQDSFGPVRTVAYTRAQDGTVTERQNATGVSNNGRRETYVEAQRAPDLLVSNLVLAKYGGLATSVTVSYRLRPGKGEVPFRDFELGDFVGIQGNVFVTPGTGLVVRCRAISVSQDNNGALTVTPEFGNQREDLDKTLERLMAKLNNGTGDGAASNFKDLIGSPTGLSPVPNIDGVTGIEGNLWGGTISTVEEVASYDDISFLVQTTAGNTVSNYTGFYLMPGDNIYVMNGEAAVGIQGNDAQITVSCQTLGTVACGERGPSTTSASRICVAVIDETSSTSQASYNANYTTFRNTWPLRELYVLRVGASTPFYIPADWEDSPRDFGPTTVNRDNGNTANRSDWYAIANLDRLPAGGKVGLFVDTSGSMTIASVQASYDHFLAQVAARGLDIITVTNANEDYITPFIGMDE